MNYDYHEKKIVIVLGSNLDNGTAVNVVGHLSITLGNSVDRKELMGRESLVDGDDNLHRGISRYPVIVTKVKPSRLKRLVSEIRSIATNKVFFADYPSDMLETAHDDDLAASLEKKKNEDITYLGVLIFGDTSEVNKLTGKFTLWK